MPRQNKFLFWLIKIILIIFLLNSYSFALSLFPVAAKQGMVVSEHPLASSVGISILRSGGNAIDAAVAVGYALAVVEPCCGNLGGGGFMTIHLKNGKNIFLNFRERAPLAARPDMFLGKNGTEESLIGYKAVAVPGTVLGLDIALKKYGKLTRAEVMAPAIQLAAKGFQLTTADLDLLKYHVVNLFFHHPHAYVVGEWFVQKNLANTLKDIAIHGPDIFYKGKIAKTIVHESQLHGGVLSLKDFSEYSVQELIPVQCNYGDYKIITAPPPSSGGIVLCETLNILENYPLKKFGFHSAKATHYIVEAMRYAFFDRKQLGDPDFVKNPIDKLLSKDYAATIIQNFLDVKATPSAELEKTTSTHEGMNTTHYSIIDKWGNSVAATVTLNSFYGAKVIAGDTGFFLNNEMNDFAISPSSRNQFNLSQGEANLIAPGKRPLSSMTPTIILQGKKVVMILGASGGPRIITTVLQTILNVLTYKMNIQDAINAPRFHHQFLPDLIEIEQNAFAHDTLKLLEKMEYQFSVQSSLGVGEAIFVDVKNKTIYGGEDHRRKTSSAQGY